MAGFVVAILVGIICIALGVSNMKGDISSVHSYHRHRVSEEDKLPFGRKVGLGTVIIGAGVVVFGALASVTLLTNNNVFIIVGSVLMTAGFVAGFALSFYAMIKYNKGIF